MSKSRDEERREGAAPLHEGRYRTVTLAPRWREALAAAEAAQGESEAGPFLHLLARAVGVRRPLLPGDGTPLTLWLAAASDGAADDGGADHDLVLGASPERVGARGLWIGDGAARPEGGAWRGIPLPRGLWLAGRGERAPRYRESDLERLVAILLAVMEPPSLVLGPDVVFDASAKPTATRVAFSGAGGAVGAGELLIAYPEGAQRYTPAPGAVALLLGEPLTPPRSDHAVLDVGETRVVLIVV